MLGSLFGYHSRPPPFSRIPEAFQMKKSVVMLCALMALAGCDQNISADLYVRDLRDLLASDGSKRLPVTMNMEINAPGLSKQCGQQEGTQIVAAIAGAFEKATVVSCGDVSGSLDDRMIIKATTYIERQKDPTNVEWGRIPLHFAVGNFLDHSNADIYAFFNADAFNALKTQLRSINMLIDPNVRDVSLTVTISNDERDPITIKGIIGSFVNGAPIAVMPEVVKLEPRQEMTIKLGDVEMSYLAQHGWIGFATIPLGDTSN